VTTERSTTFAGFGGQGLLFAGTVLARAALAEGLEVVWIPSYGPEMRGGTASCTVIVADRPIGSPIVDRLDCAVVLNPPSMARFEPVLAPGGLLVHNTSLIEAEPHRTDIEAVGVPCTRIARDAGDDRLVSIVALGAMLARRPIVSRAAAEAAIRAVVAAKHPEILEADLAAFAAGYGAAADDHPAAATGAESSATASAAAGSS
jgi:2-oxoglutarate ferredoxin oxidoreductase subunit gamma